MLDLEVANINTVITALINDHKNIPGTTPNWIVKSGTNIIVTYGYGGTQKGKIGFLHPQFELNQATKTPNGKLEVIKNYQHTGENRKKQDYIDALKCTDLPDSKNQKRVSALVILTSESCRSVMVKEAMNQLIRTDQNFDDKVWAGLTFAFKNYDKTAKAKGYKINAGETPWEPLTVQDYKNYINSAAFTGQRAEELKNIDAVDAYIRQNVYQKNTAAEE